MTDCVELNSKKDYHFNEYNGLLKKFSIKNFLNKLNENLFKNKLFDCEDKTKF